MTAPVFGDTHPVRAVSDILDYVYKGPGSKVGFQAPDNSLRSADLATDAAATVIATNAYFPLTNTAGDTLIARANGRTSKCCDAWQRCGSRRCRNMRIASASN
jgi:hypothetical protein